jgi:hypothetical protein
LKAVLWEIRDNIRDKARAPERKREIEVDEAVAELAWSSTMCMYLEPQISQPRFDFCSQYKPYVMRVKNQY